jgi:hypothetical protein
MATFTEIEAAAGALAPPDRERLIRFLLSQWNEPLMAGGDHPGVGPQRHSVGDIAPVSVGRMLWPLVGSDDLLGEMIEGRQ